MKQIRTRTKPENREVGVEMSAAVGLFKIGLVGVGIIGAIEGIIAYAFLLALDNAEVISVAPRPLFMVSAGIAWRMLRSIDISMKA